MVMANAARTGNCRRCSVKGKPKPRGNSLPAIRYEPHMKTSQSIAANCLWRIACGELPVFRKKTKDNRTWVADQEPVNMKRLEP